MCKVVCHGPLASKERVESKCLKTATSGSPLKTQREQAKEICEELDRRDTEIVAKEGLTLTQWGQKQIKKGRL